jgi:hypothetical protein
MVSRVVVCGGQMVVSYGGIDDYRGGWSGDRQPYRNDGRIGDRLWVEMLSGLQTMVNLVVGVVIKFVVGGGHD